LCPHDYKRIVVLGSTGSIGRQTLEVVRQFPERFEVVGLAAGSNWQLLAGQVEAFRPLAVSLSDEKSLPDLRRALSCMGGKGPDFSWGQAGLTGLATLPEADLVVVAVTGTAGLAPTMAALRAGKDVALANKETLVTAGQLVMDLVSQTGAALLPLDSEHSAVWQCLNGENRAGVAGIILTASGGPFLRLDRDELAAVTVEMALKHPNWQMGRKITIDSATMMNKGLEVIEARWLFGLNYNQIRVMVHPQSIIHSMVEFCDGTVMAQLGMPDMRIPIQYALTFPERVTGNYMRLNLLECRQLTFEPPDEERFPCLKLAFAAGLTGGTMPAVLNAADEVAVDAFLRRQIKFAAVPAVIEQVMSRHQVTGRPELAEIMNADNWARDTARRLIQGECQEGRFSVTPGEC